MGVVWRAWDPELGRHVALKQIRGQDAGDADARARFLREARVSARLRHPGIVALCDVGEIAGRPYLTMDLVEGGDLADGIRGPHDAASLRRFVARLADVAEAVAHAHDQGIIHRDLKPANVLLDLQGNPRVTDFGLAKEVRTEPDSWSGAATGITLAGQTLGTPEYMAPEQVRADASRIGPASDVWALGVMLYEALTGRLPFVAPSPWQLMTAVVTADPEPPRRVNPGAPADLEAVCLAALEKAAERRIPGARVLAEELRRWLRGEAVGSLRHGPARRLGRWLAGRRAAAIPLAAVALVAGVAVLLVGWEQHRQRRRSEALLREVAAAVTGFEDAILRTPTPVDARRTLAEQPLGLLEQLVMDDPGCGAAFSWRGRVRAHLGDPEAGADFDHGCLLSPHDPAVWALRGGDRLARYRALRGLPVLQTDRIGVTFAPQPPETAAERALREQGLADLARVPDVDSESADGEGIAHETSAEAALGRAVAAIHSGSAVAGDEALAALEGVSGPAADRLRGCALYLSRRFPESVEAFAKVVEAWPEDLDARGWRAQALHAHGVTELAAGRDPAEALRAALADLDRVLERDSARIKALCDRGEVQFFEGEAATTFGRDAQDPLRRAIADFTAAYLRLPGSPSILISRGTAWDALGQCESERGEDPTATYDRAIADFSESIRMAPGQDLAYHNRANAWRGRADGRRTRGQDARDDYRRAIADLDEAIRLVPGSAASHGNRGACKRALGEAEEAQGGNAGKLYWSAIEDYDEALRIAPDYLLARNNRGNGWSSLGQWEADHGGDAAGAYARAVADFDLVLERNPDYATAYSNRGLALLGLGEAEQKAGKDPGPHWEGAVRDFGETIRRVPGLYGVWVNRAQVRRKLAQRATQAGGDPRGAYREAIADLDEGLKRMPDLTSAIEVRGRCLLELGEEESLRGEDPRGNLARAIADFRVVLRAGRAPAGTPTRCGTAGILLGDAEEKLGGDGRRTFALALADLDAAKRAVPGSLRLWELCGQAARGLGDARARRGQDPAEAYGRAQVEFDELARLRPADGLAFHLRGTLAAAEGDWERNQGRDPTPHWHRAVSEYRAAIERGDGKAWLNLGIAFDLLDQPEESIAAFEAGMNAVPDSAGWAKERIEAVRTRKR